MLSGKELQYSPEEESAGGYLDEDAFAVRRMGPFRFARPQLYISEDDYLGDSADVKRSMSRLRLGKRGMGALRLGRK